ncbi:MAG: IS1 family transposase, partial [Aureispira sp.]
VDRLDKLQVFRLQADELWSFVRSKKRKRWIWVVYDPKHKLVIAQHIAIAWFFWQINLERLQPYI